MSAETAVCCGGILLGRMAWLGRMACLRSMAGLGRIAGLGRDSEVLGCEESGDFRFQEFHPISQNIGFGG